MDYFLGDDLMSKLFKEILCYFGLVILDIFVDFIAYKGNINFKTEIIDAIIILIVFLIIKVFYTMIKKQKNKIK